MRMSGKLRYEVAQTDLMLRKIAKRKGFQVALETLYRLSIDSGYLDIPLLEKNLNLNVFDPTHRITYSIQFNLAREGYQRVHSLPAGLCPICIENAGAPGKENLRILSVELDELPWFIQLTPYPLFERHFVCIRTLHCPMKVDRHLFASMRDLLRLAPDYTICANSDKAWAGASILSHLHLQFIQSLQLPLFDAHARPGETISTAGLSLGFIDYPMHVLKLRTDFDQLIPEICSLVMHWWKETVPDGTCNTVMRNAEGMSECYLLFRDPKHRNPKDLEHIKREGIGVIEAAGAWVFPPADQRTVSEVQEHREQIINTFYDAIRPASLDDRALRVKLLELLQLRFCQGY